MSKEDKQEWSEAFQKEHRGFKGRNAFKTVRPWKGVNIHDTLTCFDYKEDKSTFLKRKIRLCARGGQQIEVQSFYSSDLYASTLNESEGSRT
jgi:hypothetical protein